MGKHTPGPWVFEHNCVSSDVRPCGGITAPESSRPWMELAYLQAQPHLGFTADECNANARLIAAAPELLEALIWMVENDETNEGDVPLPDHHGATWNEINEFWIAGLNRARAAIAKATGEGA